MTQSNGTKRFHFPRLWRIDQAHMVFPFRQVNNQRWISARKKKKNKENLKFAKFIDRQCAL